MLFAPTFADKAILPTAWGGRYFFNRIGRKLPIVTGYNRPKADLFRLVQVLGFHQVNSSQVSRVER